MQKTEFMTFGTRQRLARQKCDETDISLNGQPIKHTDSFKYLGPVSQKSRKRFGPEKPFVKLSTAWSGKPIF